jgi:hypothetical protein
VSLATPDRIRKLQRALYVKAKQEPTRRFHHLYDKVWRKDILAHGKRLRTSTRAGWSSGSAHWGRRFEQDATDRSRSDG